MLRLIGFYDYTVILTYLSLISSVFGITQAIHGNYKIAILCLAVSGFCDAFDGRVARTKKNRDEDEKSFGVQLDSLCDVICFGVFPALICYLMGVRGTLGLILVFFFCICAVVRLAFFNVLEEKRQKTESGGNKTYRGLPVTSIAFILPLVFLLQFVVSPLFFKVILHIVLGVVGLLFVLDFPVRKPSFKGVLIMIIIGAIAVGVVVIYGMFIVPDPKDESNPIYEEIKNGIESSEIDTDYNNSVSGENSNMESTDTTTNSSQTTVSTGETNESQVA